MMICHAHYPAFDAERPRWPSSLSRNIITKLLRDQLGYNGLVMTDDLDMGAILNEVGFEQTIRAAMEAGNDMVMICHRVDMVEQAFEVLKTVDGPILHDALENVYKTKKRLARPSKFSLEAFAEIDQQIWDLRVDTLGEERAKILSVEDGKRSPVENIGNS